MPYKPEGYNSVSPYLVVESTDAVIAFLSAVFDAQELRRFAGPDGRVMHAEVRLDDSVIMMADANQDYPIRPADVHIYVPDVDETYRRALASGASSVQAPVKNDDPDRRAGVKAVGSEVTWWFATTVEF